MAEKVNIEILIETAKSAKGVGELRNALKKLQDAEKEVGKGSKDFDKLSSSIEKTKSKMLEEALAASKSAKSIGELRKAMKDLSSMQEEVDSTSPEFDQLINGINETEGRIGDLTDGFRTFAGSGVERANASTALLTEGLNNLDTEKVAIGVKGLTKTIQGFTEGVGQIKFGNLKKGFSELGKTGVGELTKSIISLGKAILTNPILLLAAVIVGLIAIVVKFADKIKPIKMIMDAIGKAIDFVIQKLKDFADWMGLTDFAGEDAANNQIKRNKDLEKSYTKRYDKEIKLAQAAGKDTTKLEIAKQKMIMTTTKQQMDALERLKKINGTLTKEQEEELSGLTDAYDEAYTEIQTIQLKKTKETQDKLDEESKKAKEKADKLAEDAKKKAEDKAKERVEADKNFNKQIEDQKVALIKDDEQRELAKAELDNKRAVDAINKSAASEEVKKAALLEQELTYQSEKVKIGDDFSKKKEEKDKADADKAKEIKIKALTEVGEMEKLDFDNQILMAGENIDLIAQIKLDALNAEKETRLLIAQETGENVDLINQEFANKEIELAKETEAKKVEEAKKTEETKRSLIDAGLNAAQSMTSGFFALAQAQAGADAKKQLELKKKQFKVDKALNLVKATIDGIRSVQSALTMPPPVGYVMAAFNGVMAAANIAKIASSKFEGGETAAPPSVAPPTAPGGGGGGMATPPPTNFSAGSFYGLGSGGPGGKNPTAKVIVVETDITKTQKNINKIETRATQSL